MEGSRLASLAVEASDDDVATATNRVAEWLEATGGLGAPDGL